VIERTYPAAQELEFKSSNPNTAKKEEKKKQTSEECFIRGSFWIFAQCWGWNPGLSHMQTMWFICVTLLVFVFGACMCVTEDGTQGPVYARQALYKLSHIPSHPHFF
jgi:hypothetical protein